jgi:hypothetical protein
VGYVARGQVVVTDPILDVENAVIEFHLEDESTGGSLMSGAGVVDEDGRFELQLVEHVGSCSGLIQLILAGPAPGPTGPSSLPDPAVFVVRYGEGLRYDEAWCEFQVRIPISEDMITEIADSFFWELDLGVITFPPEDPAQAEFYCNEPEP